MLRRWGCAFVLVLVACSGVQNETVPVPGAALDENVFKCNVEPILIKQCSYSACHGIAGGGTALRIYSPGKLRATPPKTIDEQIAPLTADEEHANFESAAGFNFMIDNPDDNWLLKKPLPSKLGGYEHKGGAIYHDGADPQYIAIREWIAHTGACK